VIQYQLVTYRLASFVKAISTKTSFNFSMLKGFPITSIISTVVTFQITLWDLPLPPCPFTSFLPWEAFPLPIDLLKILKSLPQRLW
jgi:hypothetical protein